MSRRVVAGFALLASVGAAAGAPRAASTGFELTLSNAHVSASIGSAGLTALKELASPGAGVKPLVLALAGDDWEATLRPGGAPDKMRRFLVTTKPANDTTLSSKACSPQPAKATQPDNLTAILSWSCAAAYTVDAVYSLKPEGSFITKTLRIRSTPSSKEFYVTSMTPWTHLSVAPAGTTVPATWLKYMNGFNEKLEIAGFVRFPELNRGIFVTVQNPFGQHAPGPAASPFPPPPPPVGPCPSTSLKGKNHVGDDLNPGGTRGLSIAGCQAACAARKDCEGFVYLPQGCNAQPSNDCYLKSNISITSEDTCACTVAKPFSGTGWQVFPGSACNNPEPPMFNKHATNSTECQKFCTSNLTCVQYMYQHQSGACWGYTKVHQPGSKGTTFDCGSFPGRVPAPPLPPGPPAPKAPAGGMVVSATYAGGVAQSAEAVQPLYHEGEGATLGLTALTAYYNDGVGSNSFEVATQAPPVGPHGKPAAVPTGLNTGEYISFTKCVEAYLLDSLSRANKTVKVNVAWDENDYQIDVGTEEGMTEYKRIIDRNAEFGVTHIVYEPFNSLRSSRKTATDGWGWEGSLWLSMGEQIRNGSWAPKRDQMPAEIQTMIDYAGSKGVKLMGYVYPCLDFVGGSGVEAALKGGSMDLSNRAFQKWMTQTLLDFLDVTGGGGFAWDHNIFAGGAEFQYAQWRAWMAILAELRTHYPEMVMDHRQTAHEWGPWYQLAGSYTEPIAGDENPETYGVPIASLHTDHVAGDNTRLINYKYAQNQLQPPSRIPGFIFHQTERTDDNGTMPCAGAGSGQRNGWKCYDMNIRDFDLLGYKYSLLSTVGTAGQNLVLTMIPARDLDEFHMLPQSDRDFITDWIKWTDTNLDFLRNTIPIATLLGPGLGRVDGTAAMNQEEGFIFLFNPSPRIHNASLVIDESLGLTNASKGFSYSVTELFPNPKATLGTVSQGHPVKVAVGGSNARVLQLTKTKKTEAQYVDRGAQTAFLPLRIDGSPAIYQQMPISPDFNPSPNNVGGQFTALFTIPAAIKAQLAARARAYPIPWTARDKIATWLDPNRLLGSIFIENPQDNMLDQISLTVDGEPLQVKRSYNSRGLNHSRTFLGYYFEASQMEAEKPHKLVLTLPKLPPGAFTGIFWENVETEY